MLVELRLVEQRYQAVLEVLDGATVTDVARRFGVARQTVHVWLGRYASDGLAGLADKTSRPLSCPHQMAPGGRGADRGDAPGASGVGAADDLVLAGAGGCSIRCRGGRRWSGVWSVTGLVERQEA